MRHGKYIGRLQMFVKGECSVQLVHLLSRVQLFVTRWSAAHEAFLSLTNSWSLLKLMSMELVGDAIQPSHPLSSPSPALSLSQHKGLFKCQFFTSGDQSIGV